MHQAMPPPPIQALLRPRAIALVGVSAKGGAGANILRSGQRFGFAVPTWPVNPNATEIDGQRCFKSLAELPGVPDCVIIALPADAVHNVVAQAAALGVRGVYVVSEGFADAANELGRERQAKLAALARAANIALAGPNCMGVASLHHRFAVTMADIPGAAAAGGVSFVSQSGGLLNSVAELATNRGIGINYLISSGNEAVLEMADYIEFLADDEPTRVIACVMEGAKNGRRFRAAVERAARKKPLVVLKLGRSAFGQRATLAHTGTLAGRHEAFAALFRQNGVALVDSIDALVETAALFDLAPLPQGDRVVMMTVSGGATSLIGDLGEAAGINFPPIAATTNARIQEILGVNKDIRAMTDAWAANGYAAIAPDLFWRLKPGVELDADIPDEFQEGLDLLQKFNADKSVEDLAASIAALRSRGCTKVGVVGYCLGGRLAFLCATRTDSDATVGYYGVGLDNLLGERQNKSLSLIIVAAPRHSSSWRMLRSRYRCRRQHRRAAGGLSRGRRSRDAGAYEPRAIRIAYRDGTARQLQRPRLRTCGRHRLRAPSWPTRGLSAWANL